MRQQLAARPAADRPGPLSTGANASPELRRQAALQQIEKAVEFIKAFGEEHVQTDEARRLVEQICRDIDALKSHLPD